MSGRDTRGATEPGRRPLAVRSSAWATAAARGLLRTRITPNQISLASIPFAALGALALVAAPARPWLFAVVVLSVALRGACNLLDGMVAVEGGRATPAGPLYNEIPDRVADTLLLVAWGYAAGQGWLGWAAALAAALTAYVRLFGGALGLPQDFRGPMAKQHRMAALSATAVVAAIEIALRGESVLLLAGLWVVVAGSLATCVTRTLAIAGRLEGQSKE